MVEEIDLGFRRWFVSAQEQTVVYVVTPEGAIDPCEQVVVFTDCIASHHGRKFVFIGQMHFTSTKLHIKCAGAIIVKKNVAVVGSFDPNPAGLATALRAQEQRTTKLGPAFPPDERAATRGRRFPGREAAIVYTAARARGR